MLGFYHGLIMGIFYRNIMGIHGNMVCQKMVNSSEIHGLNMECSWEIHAYFHGISWEYRGDFLEQKKYVKKWDKNGI